MMERLKSTLGLLASQANHKAHIGQQMSHNHCNGSMQAAIADRWEFHFMLDLLDRDFEDRRFNVGWTEHKCQMFLEHPPNTMCE